MSVSPTIINRRNSLVEAISAGAVERDLVRVHGAIVAALQSYPVEDALANVFAPALRRVELSRGPDERVLLATALRGHVARVLQGEPI
ncbi:MAG: hypothetical protein ACRDQZ_23665 [Mycobacteriales bacterium]